MTLDKHCTVPLQMYTMKDPYTPCPTSHWNNILCMMPTINFYAVPSDTVNWPSPASRSRLPRFSSLGFGCEILSHWPLKALTSQLLSSAGNEVSSRPVCPLLGAPYPKEASQQ